jgi:hypothetical protein
VSTALARLRQKIRETSLTRKPSKPSKGAFEGFEGDASRGVCPISAAAPIAKPSATDAREIDEAEREAIAIELGGVPKIYASAFAQLQAHPPPEVPLERWHQFVNDAGIFLDRWGRAAERIGWKAEELFGLHPDAPMARYDRMGLIWLLKGERVVALTATGARLSGELMFYLCKMASGV